MDYYKFNKAYMYHPIEFSYAFGSFCTTLSLITNLNFINFPVWVTWVVTIISQSVVFYRTLSFIIDLENLSSPKLYVLLIFLVWL